MIEKKAVCIICKAERGWNVTHCPCCLDYRAVVVIRDEQGPMLQVGDRFNPWRPKE